MMQQKNILLAAACVLALCSSLFGQIETEKILIDGGIDAGFWIQVMDFDKDGDDDIIAASLNSGLRWYKNDGSGNFTAIDISSAFKGAWSINASDVDGDGDLDAVACSEDLDEVAWFRRDADDDFLKFVIDEAATDPHSVYSADLDKDGDIDVMAALWGTGQIAIYENDGNESFDKQVIDRDFSSAHSVYAADMDNDTDIDILASGGSKTAVFENKGSLNFTRSIIAPFGAFGVNAVDVDKDGLLDILRGERPDEGQDVDWLENDGNLSFTEHTVESNYGESWSQTAADVDLDGDVDIIAAGFVPNELAYWLNDGSQNFSKEVLDGGLTRPRAVAVGDFDRDGDQDIAVITRNTDNLFWYKVAGSPGPSNSVIILSPNGGEVLEAGATTEISWSSVGEIDNIDLGYSLDNGQTWTEIGSGIPNSGSIFWSAPAIETDQALVRINVTGEPAIADTSDATFSLAIPILTLTAPNGGENWDGGSTQSIEWTALGPISDVGLSFSADSGATWTGISASTPNDGSFDWQVSDIQTSTALVRIWDAADNSPADTSDAVFTIVGSTLTLISPNGGEIWDGGSEQSVVWNTTGNVAQVNLEYSRDGGTTWMEMASDLQNSGSFTWTVPDQQSTQALVRVSDSADGIPSDASDAPFTILGSSLTLLIPNGGEVWYADSTRTILWASEGVIDSVMLEYSLDAGSTWTSISSSVENTGQYDWNIPQVESATVLIRISNRADGTPQDVSDSVFTIDNAFLTLTAPNGGEVWSSNSLQDITWSSDGPIDFFKLEYSLNNGVSWATIEPSVPNTGLYGWSVPDVVSNQVLVRISDAADNTPQDVSDASFVIAGTGFTLLSPNGGELLYSGTRQTIEWITNGQIDSVRLVLHYSASDSIVLTNKTANTGNYQWLVPHVTSTQARIVISDADDGVPSDTSDADFSIEESALTLTAPNGGETWLGNATQNITWETAGVVDSVQIEYSTDVGSSWSTVADAVANTGTFSWVVPNELALNALVRVSSTADNSIADVSDNTFAIISSSLTVTSPNGGEVWQRGSSQTITWHSTGVIASVNLDYSIDLGTTWESIVISTANSGTLQWLVPDIEADSVMIRVSNASNGLPSDVSDDYFKIVTDITGISGNTSQIPDSYQLQQNYPNPFNMDTRIGFSVPEPASVTLRIYNLKGEVVVTLFEGTLAPGEYTLPWNGQNERGLDLTSGVYIYRIEIGSWREARRLLLLK